MNNQITINKYLPAAILFFFFNSFLLPHGLLYSTLLTPVFLIWLFRFPTFNYLGLFFLISIPFVIAHFMAGVQPGSYVISYVLLFTVFVFCLVFYQFLQQCQSLGTILKWLAIINFLLVLLAIIFFMIPGLRDLVWYRNIITRGLHAYRLKMFTYEASYYSALLAPVALYYYLKMIFQRFPNKFFSFFVVTLPLFLSLSFGVIAAIVLTMILLFCSDIKLFTYRKKFPTYLIIGCTVLLLVLFFLILFFPDNVVFVRIANIFTGYDSSFKGRTFDSIFLGWELAAKKNLFFGCGPGQIKEIGLELFNTYYKNSYSKEELAVPNGFGDTMATFGILGALLKIMLVFYFFFRTKVYQNFYRLAIFLFIFIYQFTGSYLTNVAEYAVWIMAFYPPLFPEFNKTEVYRSQEEPPSYSELKPAT